MDEYIARGEVLYEKPGGFVCFKMMEPGSDFTGRDIEDIAHKFLVDHGVDNQKNLPGDIVESHVTLADYDCEYYGVKPGTWILMLRMPEIIRKSYSRADIYDLELQIHLGRSDEPDE